MREVIYNMSLQELPHAEMSTEYICEHLFGILNYSFSRLFINFYVHVILYFPWKSQNPEQDHVRKIQNISRW